MKKYEQLSSMKTTPQVALSVYSFDYLSPEATAKSKLGVEIVGKVKTLENVGVQVHVLSKDNINPFASEFAKMGIHFEQNTNIVKMLESLSPRKIFLGDKSSIVNEDYCENICFSSFEKVDQAITAIETWLVESFGKFDIDENIVYIEEEEFHVEEVMLAATLLGHDVEAFEDSFVFKNFLANVS